MDFDSFTPQRASTNPQANTASLDAPPVDSFESFEPAAVAPSVAERNTAAIGGLSVSRAPVGETTVLADDSPDPAFERAQLEELASHIFTPDQIEEFKNNPITWSSAYKYLGASTVPLAGGVIEGIDAGRLLLIARKQENGEELTPTESEFMREELSRTVEMGLRGMTIGGKIVYGAAQVPAFGIDLLVSGGVGKLAQKATTGAVASAAEKSAVAAAVKSAEKAGMTAVEKAAALKAAEKASLGLATKSAGVAANVAGRVAALAPNRYFPAYAERRLSDEIAVTDKGELILKEAEESPAKSALMAFGYTSAEILSEYSGGLLGKFVTTPALNVVTSPMLAAARRLPAPVQQGLYEAYKKVKPNAKLSEVLSAAGWNGMLNELGEERIAEVLKATVGVAGGDIATFDDYLDAITPSKEQLLVEAGIISLVGGVRSAADITLNILQSKGVPEAEAKETVENMTANEQDVFVNKNLPPPATPDLFDTFVEKVVNQTSALEKLPERAEAAGVEVAPSSNTKLLLSAFMRVGGQAVDMLRNGIALLDDTGNYQRVGKGLKDVLDDYNNYFAAKETDAEVRRQDLEDYLIAQRYTEDLAKIEGVEVTDAQREKSISDLLRLQTKYGEDMRWMETFAQEVYQFQRDARSMLVQSGLISQERSDELDTKHPHYVPFQRVFEDAELAALGRKEAGTGSSKGNTKSGGLGKVLKKITGSEREVKDILGSIMRNTINTVDIASWNNIKRSIADLAEVFPDEIKKVPAPVVPKGIVRTVNEKGETLSEKTVFGRNFVGPEGTMVVYRDGKAQYYELSPQLLGALESLKPEQLGLVAKFFATSARVLSATTTTLPRFLLWTTPRETHVSFLQSGKGHSLFTPLDTLKGAMNILGDTKLYSHYKLAGGAANAYMEMTDTNSIEKAVQHTLYDSNAKMFARWVNPLNWIESPAKLVDQAPRVGAFKKAKEDGFSDLEASFYGQNISVDFSRRGAASKAWSRYLPFVNAGIQGSRRLVLAARDAPAAFTALALGTITAPSLAIAGYYLFMAPDDEREEYLNFPDYVRDTRWLFKIDGTWHAWPKPFAPGYVFGTLPERMLLWAYGQDYNQAKRSWLSVVKSMVGTLSPIDEPTDVIPPLAKAFLENLTNQSFFTGRNIVPEWLEGKVEPYLEVQPFTTQTARELGKLFDYSPAKIENAVRSQFGTVGTMSFQYGDKVLAAVDRAQGEPVAEKPLRLRDHFFIGNYYLDDPLGTGSNALQRFYQNRDEVEVAKNTQGHLEGKDRSTYEKDKVKVLNARGIVEATSKQIRALNKQIDTIYEDTKMDAETKAKRIRGLRQQQTDIAAEANRAYYTATKGVAR